MGKHTSLVAALCLLRDNRIPESNAKFRKPSLLDANMLAYVVNLIPRTTPARQTTAGIRV